MQYLYDNGLLKGSVLDYGCGRGQDVDRLALKGIDIEGFDPYWRKWDGDAVAISPVLHSFDTVTCNYVLNVIENQYERQQVVLDIVLLLKDGGKGYISVRNDKKNLKGYTSKGTWQGYVEVENFTVVIRTPNYVMYEVTR
jgi:2-polyprenyl-3-methyl-5-hydroxy-6-metoxy-1,4-benzoquinol methylase